MIDPRLNVSLFTWTEGSCLCEKLVVHTPFLLFASFKCAKKGTDLTLNGRNFLKSCPPKIERKGQSEFDFEMLRSPYLVFVLSNQALHELEILFDHSFATSTS